jgi:Ca2+:H+ antiporter
MHFRYICSRIFLHNPPGPGNSELAQHKLAPEALKERAIEMDNEDPEVNQWVCIGMLVITIAIMGATAEWVSTISPAPFSYRHPLLVG